MARKVGHWALHRYRPPFWCWLQTIGLPVLETPVAPGVLQNAPGVTLAVGVELGLGTGVVDGASGGEGSTAAGPGAEANGAGASAGLSVADAATDAGAV